MGCSNCFNGCAEIISDQCVKYTGNDIPALGIESGDTLANVESQIITYITNLATGEGIIPVIAPEDLCDLVSGFLPGSGDITLNDVLSALTRSICSLKESVDGINSTLAILNADYTIGCLTGVTASSDTHDILQAAITKLCATDSALTAFILDVTTNYVKLDDLNTLIQAYLNSISPVVLQNSKMVPRVAYEYYGSLTGFDVTGAGSGQWDRVFLCNGNNGTPDKRGRVAAGTTDGSMGATVPMNAAVDPAIPNSGNPTYVVGQPVGTNSVILQASQIPAHIHTATATSTADPHTHFISRAGNSGPNLTGSATLDMQAEGSPDRFSYTLKSTPGIADAGITNSVTVNVATSVSLTPTGGGLAHTNVQPSIGAYFIMYIP
jgi:microcystin-dependent protein